MITHQLCPDSRGGIVLRGADPSDASLPRPNYLSAVLDQRTIVAGSQMCRRVLPDPHLQHFVESEYLPGPDIRTDDALLDFARRPGGSVFHPASACKMGGDPMAVADPALCIHGLSGPRVEDARVIPPAAWGNSNALTIMVAGKASDMLRPATNLAAQDGLAIARTGCESAGGRRPSGPKRRARIRPLRPYPG